MKTWQMIRALTENHDLKFKRIKTFGFSTSGEILKKVGKRFYWNGNEDYPFYLATGHLQDDEWELIQEPVDFMVAINSGKRIRSVSLSDFKDIDYWLREAMFDLDMINGKWYIEEDK